MKVNITKTLEKPNTLNSIINKIAGEPNEWYRVNVDFELDDNEKTMYSNFLKDKENKGFEKSVLLTLPMWGKDKRLHGWTADTIVNVKNKCSCFANNNIDLIDIENTVHKEAKEFKQMLLNFTEVKDYNSKNQSGSSSFEI